MQKSPVFIGLALLLGLSACAGAEGGDAADRINLTALDVEGPRVDTRYPAILSYEAKGDVKVVESCFCWSGTGPYCFAPAAADTAGTIKSMVVTGYSGTYELEGYVHYRVGDEIRKSNKVSTEITVVPRY